MRKFHFAQPFIASYNALDTAMKTGNALNSMDINDFAQREQANTTFKTEQPSVSNTLPNNDYVSGVIDLDRALEEYYKSLIR